MSIRRALLIFILCTAGIVIRVIILSNASLTKALGNRIEISTPLTAWKRAVEGVSLKNQGTSPYDGDNFHESPLALLLYEFLISHLHSWIPVIFAVCDLLTAVALSLASKIYTNDVCKREKNESRYPPSAASYLMKVDQVKYIPFYVAVVYLLCPYSILSCGGKSTVVFQNLILSVFILATSAGQWFLASLFLAFISYQSLYHISLLVPLVMYVHQKTNGEKFRPINLSRLLASVLVTFVVWGCLVGASYKTTQSWKFLWSTYGCILAVPDLTPNIGLFWYFFTEMFEHFRVFFLCTFQLNVFVYTAPLAIRLRKEPMLLLFVHLLLITVFKSYPCIGDVALYLALLPMWSHLFHIMRQRFIAACVLASCTLLAPTLWHLWIYSGSANANFFFAITLAFNTGQIFLLTDILSAFIKREYYLQHGVKCSEDGNLVMLRLK